MSDTLRLGEFMVPGQRLDAANGQYTLLLQGDGNMVLYAGRSALWASGTMGQPVTRAALQPDTNFVLYAGERAVWNSGTMGHPNAFLIMQSDGNLVLYTERPEGNLALWNTQTANQGHIIANILQQMPRNRYAQTCSALHQCAVNVGDATLAGMLAGVQSGNPAYATSTFMVTLGYKILTDASCYNLVMQTASELRGFFQGNRHENSDFDRAFMERAAAIDRFEARERLGIRYA